MASLKRLADVRGSLLDRDHMTLAERTLVLDQAQSMIDSVYVHRPQKSAMYGINPGQQLWLLGRQLPALSDAAFHYSLLRVFDSLRDMHTTYVLPTAYRKRATLGIALERYWRAGRPRFIVSKVDTRLVTDKRLKPGVEVRYWNGMPIQAAVERNAEAEAGGNPAARLAQGLDTMTVRSLALSPMPAEDWVDLRFRAENGKRRRVRLHWRVTDEPDGLPLDTAAEGAPRGYRLGIGQRTESTRRSKVELFARQKKDKKVRGQKVVRVDGPLRRELRALKVKTSTGTYGYLRIFTFQTAEGDVQRFLREVRRLLRKLPQKGLILDVRGNGGGYIDAAEGLLQYLTKRRPIRPEPMQLISSDTTYQLSRRSAELAAWRPSLGEAGETGEQYSAALPLDAKRTVNRKKCRAYQGPVVLITDALSYSATDIFAAGFQDNRIGPVLGVDDNTGAGGANVWSLGDLVRAWPNGPFRTLPQDARLYVALRRSLRVGWQAGRPVEDLGVVPDVRYRMTRDDLLHQNRDLIERAGQVLKRRRPRRVSGRVLRAVPATVPGRRRGRSARAC